MQLCCMQLVALNRMPFYAILFVAFCARAILLDATNCMQQSRYIFQRRTAICCLQQSVSPSLANYITH